MILSRVIPRSLLLAAALAPTSLLSQTKVETTIDRLAPEAAAIVPRTAQLEKMVTCCKWLEGPAWSPDGRLFFSDTDLNETLILSADGKLSTFKKPSGLVDPSFHGKEPGTDGNTFDSSGRFTVAGHALRKVFRYDRLEPSSSITVLADHYQGKRFNSPNDVVYASDGTLFFTDPPYGLATQQDNDPKKELPFNGVFMIRGAAHRAQGSAPTEPVLLIRDMTRPNGVALSPDEKFLYVANSDPANPVWMRFPLAKNGTVGAGKVLLSAKGAPGIGGPDGIRVDVNGNLYGSGPGGIWIISPEGKHIATIHVPEQVSNCGWGGADWQTLYITASSSVYRIHLNVKGLDLTRRH
jgi:gluconolactonase